LLNSYNTHFDTHAGYIVGTACSKGNPDRAILPILEKSTQLPSDKGEVILREKEVALSPIGGKHESRDPQVLLDKLNFQLVDKFGKEIKVTVSPHTYEKKRRCAQKELNRLASSINYAEVRGRMVSHENFKLECEWIWQPRKTEKSKGSGGQGGPRHSDNSRN